MANERQGAVTFKGTPLTLVGSPLRAGDQAPDFSLLAQDLSTVTLASSNGKTRLISVVPSLDTPVCDQQTRRFNDEAAKLPDSVAVITVSADLPFAQARYCGAAGVDRIQTLSDHREVAFGQAYGVLVKELRLLARSVFVVDPQGRIQYAEYVKEITSLPNFEAALDAARRVAGQPVGGRA